MNVDGSLKCIGDVMREQGKPAEALEAYQQGRDILRTLVQRDQTDSAWQEWLSISLGSIGDVLRGQGKLDQALEAYQEEGETVHKLVQRNQTNSHSRDGRAFSLL